MDEILSVFNAYKKRVFNGIRTEVKANLEDSYLNEMENWDALGEEEKNEWESLEIDDDGGYGAWWYEWIDDPYQGIGEYVQDLWDSNWSNNEVLNQTLDARVGLDPKTVYDELSDLVYRVARNMAGLPELNKVDKQPLLDFINWPVDNPKELM